MEEVSSKDVVAKLDSKTTPEVPRQKKTEEQLSFASDKHERKCMENHISSNYVDYSKFLDVSIVENRDNKTPELAETVNQCKDIPSSDINVSEQENSLSCKKCERKFFQKRSLNWHMRTHKEDKPFTRKDFGKGFSDEWALNDRAQINEKTGSRGGCQPFTCKVCVKSFSEKENIDSHMKTHLEERPFTCTECGKGFKLKGTLKIHMRTHTGERPFTCKECGKGFSQKKCLDVHVTTHTGFKPFRCKQCGKGFSRKEHLETHARIHTGEKPFTCNECGRAYRIKRSFDMHMKKHEMYRDVKFGVCGHPIIKKQDVNIPRIVHTGPKPFLCDRCGKIFSQLGGLNVHKRAHKPVVRDERRKGLGQSGSVYLVLVKVPTKIKSFVCEECGKEFRLNSLLKLHKSCHTRDRPFTCKECGRGFSSKPYLGRHMKRHKRSQLLYKNVRKKVHPKINIKKVLKKGDDKQLFPSDKREASFARECHPDLILVDHGNFLLKPLAGKEVKKFESVEIASKCMDIPVTFEANPVDRNGKNSASSSSELDVTKQEENWLSSKDYGDRFSLKRPIDAPIRIHTGDKQVSSREIWKVFSQESVLDNRMRIHSIGKPFICNICGKEFRLKSLLNLHKSGHARDRHFTCTECGRGFSSKPFLGKHMNRHRRGQISLKDAERKIQSKISSKVVPSKENERSFPPDKLQMEREGKNREDSDFVDYSNIIDNIVEREIENSKYKVDMKYKDSSLCSKDISVVERKVNSLTCHECGKGFRQKRNLDSHMKTHTGNEPFASEASGKDSSQKKCLDFDVQHCTANKPFICNGCGKKFSQDVLALHIRLHAGDKPFACDKCGKSFRIKKSLIMYVTTHRRNKPAWEDTLGRGLIEKYDHERQGVTPTESKSFLCDVCGKTFRQEVSLKVHMRTHTGDKPFRCKECGKAFSLKGNLHTHLRTHTGVKPFTCMECGKGFSQKKCLDMHTTTHTGIKPLSCRQCGKGFGRKEHLETHVRIHTGEKPFVCDDCGKSYRIKRSFDSHMKKHKKNRLINCNSCGKGFVEKRDLNNHMVTHAGEKPFLCDNCGKGFNEKVHLDIHKRTHSEDKLFICHECGEGFKLKYHLNLHKSSHAGNKAFTCKECGLGFRTNHTLCNHMKRHRKDETLCKDAEKAISMSNPVVIMEKGAEGQIFSSGKQEIRFTKENRSSLINVDYSSELEKSVMVKGIKLSESGEVDIEGENAPEKLVSSEVIEFKDLPENHESDEVDVKCRDT